MICIKLALTLDYACYDQLFFVLCIQTVKFVHHREIWMAYEPMTNKSYWKVCGNMDPLKCSNMWVLHTSPENHAIKSYESFIMNPPSVFLDKFSTRYKRWLDALQNSCVVNYKIEKIEHKGILDINLWKKQRTPV